MSWFLFAFIAPVLWSLVNISDQYLVAKYGKGKKGPGALVIFSSMMGIFVAVAIAIFAPGSLSIPIIDMLLLLLSGLLTILWIIFYLFALGVEEASGVVPWFVTVPVFGYILGYFFLGEDLTTLQKTGSIIVLLGTLILSFDFSQVGKYIFKKKVAAFMIPVCLIVAVMEVIFKYVTIAGDFWVSNFWINVGLGISGVLIYIFSGSYRRSFWQMLNQGGGKIFALNTTSEVATIAGNLAMNYATLLAPVVLVLMVANFQPAILLVFTLIGHKLFPNVIKEDFSKRVLVPKIIAIVVMVAGSLLLLY